MEPRVIDDDVKQEKEKAMDRFNRFHCVAKLWHFLQVLALVSCSTAVTGRCLVHLISNYLLNHHVVFLIGNSIIVFLFMLCRQSDATGADIYDEYVAAAAVQLQPDLFPPVESDGERQIVVRAQEAIATGGVEAAAGQLQPALPPPVEEADAIPPCDDVAVAIEKAKRLIQRFQRTQSEKLKREISVRRRPELRRSETDNHHREVSEIETLSNEEFRRRVDAFIDKHWSGKGTKTNEFTEYENYALLKMS